MAPEERPSNLKKRERERERERERRRMREGGTGVFGS